MASINMEISDNLKYMLFLFVCIPLRFYIAYICYRYKDERSMWTDSMALLIALLALSFIALYLRIFIRDYGWEAPTKKIWWNFLRPIIATLYLCYICCYLLKIRHGWIFMIAEPVIGLIFSLANKFF